MGAPEEFTRFLLKQIERFFFRDLFYIIGGSTIVFAFLLLFKPLAFWYAALGWLWLAILPICYAVGYTVTVIFGLTVFGRTAVAGQPWPITKCLLKLHWPGYEYSTPAPSDWLLWQVVLSKCSDHHLQPLIGRINALKHLCASLGSSLLVATLIIAVKGWFWNTPKNPDIINFARVAPFATGVMAIVLLILNRVHLYHEHSLEVEMAKSMDENMTQTALGKPVCPPSTGGQAVQGNLKPHVNNGGKAVDEKTMYDIICRLVTNTEHTRWARLNTLLVLNTLLLLAWTMILNVQAWPYKAYVLLLLSILGTVISVLWSFLGHRTNQFHKLGKCKALSMEENMPQDLPKPFHDIDEPILKQWKKYPCSFFTSSAWLVRWIPLLFAAVFVVLTIMVLTA